VFVLDRRRETATLTELATPSYVTPVVVYLASEQNTATRGFHSATGDRVRRARYDLPENVIDEGRPVLACRLQQTGSASAGA
jgi:hypothetical protein